MENAAKALIIAGAILIAILLISIGILVMNSINNPLSQAEDEGNLMSAQMYNAKFTNYAGTRTAKEVSELMDVVISTNASFTNNNIVILTDNLIDGEGGWIYREPDELKRLLSESETYEVRLGGHSNTTWIDPDDTEHVSRAGYVETIMITRVSE